MTSFSSSKLWDKNAICQDIDIHVQNGRGTIEFRAMKGPHMQTKSEASVE